MAKLPFSEEFSQSIEVLLPGNHCQFGLNELTKILTGLDVPHVDRIHESRCEGGGGISRN